MTDAPKRLGAPAHTPGPWSINAKRAPWICTVGNNSDDPAVFGHPVPDGQRYVFGDKMADARLIAAAPELLEALNAMVEAYWRGSEDSTDENAPACVKDALAAIAKANSKAPTETGTITQGGHYAPRMMPSGNIVPGGPTNSRWRGS